jgi:hypothetical protein
VSRFYASIQGSRGEATRQGRQDITGHIRGWEVGVRVFGCVGDDGEDMFNVFMTGGSDGNTSDRLIATVKIEKVDGKPRPKVTHRLLDGKEPL